MTPGETTAEGGDPSVGGEPVEPSGSPSDPVPEEHPLPPGPDGYPVVGSLPRLVRDPFAFYDDLAEYGDVVRFTAGRNAFTTLLRPEYVERVLVEEPWRFQRWEFADVGLDFAPEGLLAVDGDRWRRQRRTMQPAFEMDRIRSYADAMVAAAERRAVEWDDGQEVDLNRALAGLTLEILAKTLFDVDLDPADDEGVIADAVRAINERSGPGRNLTMLLPDWVPTPAQRRYDRAIARYRRRVEELLDRRRSEGADGDDLLSILLSAEGPSGQTLSEEEVRDNLITFAFAGHETTALGLAYAFMLLAEHGEVAENLRAELDEVLGGESPRFEHVPDLTYTDRVIREAMRLYPPAFVLFRRATEDAVIGGYRIPEGTILTLPQFRLHVDERFYDDPHEFRPERWADDCEADRPEYAYFPFGGGPRHCVGMRFATLEMKLVVATLAREFDLTLLSDPDPDPTAGATLRPDENVRVRVHRR